MIENHSSSTAGITSTTFPRALVAMAPDDTRNIFYNTAGGGSKTDEQLPSMVLPVVFPHHLLMMAVASTATKL